MFECSMDKMITEMVSIAIKVFNLVSFNGLYTCIDKFKSPIGEAFHIQ